MKKLLCFIYDDMVDFEMTLACHLAGRRIVPVAYERKVIKSHSGIGYYPEATVKEILEQEGQEIGGIIIPGGQNDEVREELMQLIRKLNGEGKMLAAICAGPQYLARAGVLKGKKYTTVLNKENLKEYFPHVTVDPFPRESFVEAHVVCDHNIITAVGNAFVEFAVEVSDYLGNFGNEQEKAKCLDHYRAYRR